MGPETEPSGQALHSGGSLLGTLSFCPSPLHLPSALSFSKIKNIFFLKKPGGGGWGERTKTDQKQPERKQEPQKKSLSWNQGNASARKMCPAGTKPVELKD